MAGWTQTEGIALCRQIEQIAPRFGAHVALTGGLLYRDGERKDCDILVYRIRQVEHINWTGLWVALRDIGIFIRSDYGWCKKAVCSGKEIDFFDPEADGVYGAYSVDMFEPVLPVYEP